MDIKLGWKKRFLWLPPIAIGILVFLLAPSFKQAPPQKQKAAPPKVVRVMKLQPRSIQPQASGYGYVQASEEWQLQSELAGTIIWVSDNLENGQIINKGEIVAKIDPAPYQLNQAQLQAQLDVITLKDQTIRASINIAEQDLALQQEELKRNERLNKTGNISQTTRDASERQYLSSQQQLQTLKNGLLINQAEKKVLDSQLALVNLDLQKTVIRAPFDIRLTQVNIGIAQYVNRGELMLKADGIAAAEVSAQFPIGKMRPLRRAAQTTSRSKSTHSDLQAQVELHAVDKIISWPGIVDRTGGLLDSKTQSQTIVIRVDQPYQQAVPGTRPPLLSNTFVKVTLRAPVLDNQLLLPITALHNNQVYILDAEKRLHIKNVEVDFIQDQIAVIKAGLSKGDLIVLSPLFPAIEGMKLKPQPDKEMVKWIEQTTGFKRPSNKQGAL